MVETEERWRTMYWWCEKILFFGDCFENGQCWWCFRCSNWWPSISIFISSLWILVPCQTSGQILCKFLINEIVLFIKFSLILLYLFRSLTLFPSLLPSKDSVCEDLANDLRFALMCHSKTKPINNREMSRSKSLSSSESTNFVLSPSNLIVPRSSTLITRPLFDQNPSTDRYHLSNQSAMIKMVNNNNNNKKSTKKIDNNNIRHNNSKNNKFSTNTNNSDFSSESSMMMNYNGGYLRPN